LGRLLGPLTVGFRDRNWAFAHRFEGEPGRLSLWGRHPDEELGSVTGIEFGVVVDAACCGLAIEVSQLLLSGSPGLDGREAREDEVRQVRGLGSSAACMTAEISEWIGDWDEPISRNRRRVHRGLSIAHCLPPYSGFALSCRQGPPPWPPGAPTVDARQYRGRFDPGP
jgi:hypothetical protein